MDYRVREDEVISHGRGRRGRIERREKNKGREEWSSKQRMKQARE